MSPFPWFGALHGPDPWNPGRPPAAWPGIFPALVPAARPPPPPPSSRVLAGILGGTLGVLYHAEEVGECSVQRADLTVLVLRFFPQRRRPSYDWYTQCHFLSLSDRNSLRRSRNPHKYFAMDVEDEENMSKT